ncbi:MAG: PEGA domain-containing protein [Candidatus Krumholzibacteriota bacterium]
MIRHISPLLGALVLAAIIPAAGAAATLEITGPPGASLSINGRGMGFFPLDGPLDLAPGTYAIKSELPGYITYEQELELSVDSSWQRLVVRLVPYSRKTAWTSSLLFAGLGQHYLGRSTRGYIYNVAEAGGLLVALVSELERSNLRKDYLNLQEQYDSSINAEDIVRFREAADQAYNDMLDQEDRRNLGLLVAGGAVVISVLDAILFFPAVEAGAGPVPLDTGAWNTLDPGPWSGPDPLTTVHASVRLEF